MYLALINLPKSWYWEAVHRHRMTEPSFRSVEEGANIVPPCQRCGSNVAQPFVRTET